MKLVIVESPTKSKTIAHYLGSEYRVEASKGHIRDLSTRGKDGLGIDVEHNFIPDYVIIEGKEKLVRYLQEISSQADEVILATDPDREGEAIAWHLAKVLNLPIETTKRLEFHEITKNSIEHAINDPRTIDMKLFDSQEARREIDRILGFKLSKLLKQKISSDSAGRVQSVTLGLICDLEKEIEAFVPQEYWTIKTSININDKEYELELYKDRDKQVDTYYLKNENDANRIINSLSNKVKVTNIEKSTKNISSREPFRTSTLEQVSNSVLHFKSKTTSAIAQQLYEGIKIKKDLVGLITYMRTDSVHLSDTFVNEAKAFIIHKYGKEYYKGRKTEKKVNLSQGAHEAIRPTSLDRTPELIKEYLTKEQYRLYKLIYDRTISSLMSDRINEITTVTLKSNDISFLLKGSKTVFPGYNIIKIDDVDNKELPIMAINNEYDFALKDKEQKFTTPPTRFSEGKLIKRMEEDGIGRPSTYSATIQTLLNRKYVTLEKGLLVPTEQGKKTSTVLKKYFIDIMNVGYTANMELELDKIQSGEAEKVKTISDFYKKFIVTYNEAKEKMYKDPPEYVGEKCPQCGAELVYKKSKYGTFIGCSNYPHCRYIRSEKKNIDEPVGRNCPKCGKPLVYKINKYGDKFITCGDLKCKYTESVPDEVILNAPVKMCPECGSGMSLKKAKGKYFYGCNKYPECKHTEKYNVKK